MVDHDFQRYRTDGRRRILLHWKGNFCKERLSVKTLLIVIGWCILFVLSWPVALLVLVLWPIVWLLSIPFRLVGIALDGVFALLRSVILLPARLLGYRSPATR